MKTRRISEAALVHVIGARKSPIAGSTEGGETSRTRRTPDQIYHLGGNML